MTETINLTQKQQRLLALVYKFRFVTSPLLSKILNIGHVGTYKSIEVLVKKGLVNKVYEKSWHIDRRPAYYYLSKKGVTTIRKKLDLDDSAVNTIYQDHRVSEDFIRDCLNTLACYAPIKEQHPDAVIRTKTEINRYDVFPNHKPDMYIKASDGQEAFVVVLPEMLPYFVNNRLNEYINHSEDEGWRGKYPTIAFIIKNDKYKNGFLFKTKSKLEDMGMDESEITILATSKESLLKGDANVWSNAFNPQKATALFI